jgi:hypothetical protein
LIGVTPAGSALPAPIAAAFLKQAEFCRLFAAPLTAAVCEAAVFALDNRSATGRAIIGWTGNAVADALMMRWTGGCNALVRAGRAPELAALYPPAALPSVEALAKALRLLLADPARDADLCGWLTGPPQTNEVARSGVLMPGMMVIAAATGLPLRLFELGCSAGLNLNLDRFGYDLGGQAPPSAAVEVLARRGTDINPLDVGDASVRERLLAYVWPDQPERVARAEAAIALAESLPPLIDRADAADWLEKQVDPQPGSVAVVFHSIAYQYFPSATKARIASHMAVLGASATPAAPLAWLRYEMDDASVANLPTLRLTLWQGGDASEQLLAHAHPHGSFVQWHG